MYCSLTSVEAIDSNNTLCQRTVIKACMMKYCHATLVYFAYDAVMKNINNTACHVHLYLMIAYKYKAVWDLLNYDMKR